MQKQRTIATPFGVLTALVRRPARGRTPDMSVRRSTPNHYGVASFLRGRMLDTECAKRLHPRRGFVPWQDRSLSIVPRKGCSAPGRKRYPIPLRPKGRSLLGCVL